MGAYQAPACPLLCGPSYCAGFRPFGGSYYGCLLSPSLRYPWVVVQSGHGPFGRSQPAAPQGERQQWFRSEVTCEREKQKRSTHTLTTRTPRIVGTFAFHMNGLVGSWGCGCEPVYSSAGPK